MSKSTHSVESLVTALGWNPPTDEQIKVITSPAHESALVIAGAGSGKTTTMSQRVTYLVANGFVKPSEVLAMTFTRKAAGELAHAIRSKLYDLASSERIQVDHHTIDDAYGVTATTYNSFANRVFADYAHLVGRDPGAIVISEATAWQLARSVVVNASLNEFDDLSPTINSLTELLLKTARSLNDNMQSTDALRQFATRVLSELRADMPIQAGKHGKTKNRDSFEGGRKHARQFLLVADLVDRYEALKLERNFIEFSDQVKLAAELVKLDIVRDTIRSQYKVVLLDEYQDTSNVQIRFLSELFRGIPVTAVGDPNQAIYGWRGASAASMNITNFFAAYLAPDSAQSERHVYPLSRSWRNPEAVLKVANRIAAVLEAKPLINPGDDHDYRYHALEAGDKKKAGSVQATYFNTVDEEAQAVARWFDERISAVADPGAKPTAVVLSRKIAELELFKRAFEENGVPYRVVGLGGLMSEPVIVDLVCALRVIHFANADSELIRLLAGPRWMIAPRDLRGLNHTAKWLSQRDEKQQRFDDELVKRLDASVAPEEGASLVDALDFVAEVSDLGHRALERISEDGRTRLREAGRLFQRLRRRTGLELRELTVVVLQELRLDIEAEANETSPSSEPAISAFMDAIGTYGASAENVTLGGFLGWLENAEERDRLSPASAKPEHGVVQLMTIHGAKGLEWDLVAVPRQTAPAGDKSATWLVDDNFPDDLRQDRAELLPAWKWWGQPTQVDLEESFQEHKQGSIDRQLAEERRLAYVAVTRAKHDVLITGAYWNDRANAYAPNDYFNEAAEELGVSDQIPALPAKDDKPDEVGEFFSYWPQTPFGSRRAGTVEQAAQLVASVDSASAIDPAVAEEILTLVAERDSGPAPAQPVPSRISASRFKEYIADARGVAETLKRPMPTQPFRATSLGTIFHEWVETRAVEKRDAHTPDTDTADFEKDSTRDELGTVIPTPSDEVDLAALQAIWEKSEWASQLAHETEIEIQLPFGRHNNTLICKIDAIYRSEVDGVERYEIVDWKTGKAPTSDDDIEERQFQLALYRLAYSRFAGIPEENIDAALYFVAHDLVVRPQRIWSEDELATLWDSIFVTDN